MGLLPACGGLDMSFYCIQRRYSIEVAVPNSGRSGGADKPLSIHYFVQTFAFINWYFNETEVIES